MAVEFDEPMVSTSLRRPQRPQGAVTRLFFKLGLAKDAKSAQTVMTITALIFFALTAYVIYAYVSGPSTSLSPQQHDDIIQDLDTAGRGGR